MKAAYSDVPKRLKEERVRMGLSQQSMSRLAGISQANYAKAEAGTRRLGYYELKRMGEAKLDLLYVFCGMRCKEHFLQRLAPYRFQELLSLLNIFVSLAQLQGKGRALDRWRRLPWHTEMFHAWEEGTQLDCSGFVQLRHSVGKTQLQMAEKLGVDVKKLRDMENGIRLPDSEILWRLCTEFEVSPAVLLKDRNCLASEVGCFLESDGCTAEDGLLQMAGEFQALPKAL